MAKSTKRLIKRIFWFFVLSFLAISIVGVSLAYIYEDEVKQYAIAQINEHTKTKIKVEDIELSFLRRFPMAALDFKNVQMEEALEKGTPGILLMAEHIYLKFNVIDLLQKRIILKKLEIDAAKLNLVVFKDGSDNYHIFKNTQSDNSDFLLELDKLTLKNSILHYTNYASQQNLDMSVKKTELSGRFSTKAFHINLSGNTQIEQYRSENLIMIQEKSLKVDVNFGLDSTSDSYLIKKGNITYNGIPLDISGSIKNQKQGVLLDLKMNSKKLLVSKLVNSLPQNYKARFKDYTLKGNVQINAAVKGAAVARSVPNINIRVLLEQGKILHKPTSTEINNIHFNLAYNNGSKHSLHTSVIKVSGFGFSMASGTFKGRLQLNDFIHTKVRLQVSANLDLEQFIKFTGKLYGIKELGGHADLELNLSADIKGLVGNEDFSSSNMNYKANIKMQGAKLRHSASNVLYENINGSLRINPYSIVIEPTDLQVNGHTHHIRAEISNYRNWAADPEHNKLRIRSAADISSLSYDDILRIIGDSEDSDGTFPTYLDLQINFKADTFLWENMVARQASGFFSIRNQSMSFDNIRFRSFGGDIQGSCIIKNSVPDKKPIFAKGSLNHVDINRLFQDFHNFDQSLIKDKNIKGKLTADFTFNAHFDRNWEVVSSSIILQSKVKINGGELNNVKELNALSNYTRIKDFSHITFSELQNTIQVRNDTIIIPDMKVQSNKLDLDIAGINTFDLSYDYHISVLMSDILFKKAKEESPNEFGEVQSDGYGKTRLFFHVYGKGDDLHVKYDNKGVAKKLKNDLKEEGQELKTVLNKEFGLFKKSQDSSKVEEKRIKEQEKSELKKQEEGEFIFEWDDEEESGEEPPE